MLQKCISDFSRFLKTVFGFDGMIFSIESEIEKKSRLLIVIQFVIERVILL